MRSEEKGERERGKERETETRKRRRREMRPRMSEFTSADKSGKYAADPFILSAIT